MHTLAVVAIATGVVVAAGTAFALDDPFGLFAPECTGEPTPSLPAGSDAYRLRLTLQDNKTGSDVRTCFLDDAGNTMFDQTYRVEGETGWMWDIYLPQQPHTWIVQFGSAPGLDLPSLQWYLDGACEGVTPEFLSTHQSNLIMVDCALPSEHIPDGMQRRYAPSTSTVQTQAAIPWTPDEPLQGGGAAAASVIVTTSVAGFVGIRFRREIHWIAAGLFTRIVKPRVLEHPVRNEVMQLVQAEPGIHRAEIARRLELAVGQTIHHLRVLVEQRLLCEIPNGWKKHYVPAGRYSPQTARQLVAMRNKLAATLLDLARANPGASLQRLSLLASQSKSNTSKTLKHLIEVGLARVERDGKWVRVYAEATKLP